jgi:hypothetical protein
MDCIAPASFAHHPTLPNEFGIRVLQSITKGSAPIELAGALG